jgi:hypothetical protein
MDMIDTTATKDNVFLYAIFQYSKCTVPREIIDLAYRTVPTGFKFGLLAPGTASPEKTKDFAEADYRLGYPGDMTEREIRAATRWEILPLMSAGYDRTLLPVTPGSVVSMSRLVISPASRGVKHRPMSSREHCASDAGNLGE